MAGSAQLKQLPQNLRYSILAGGFGYLFLYAAWLMWGRQDPSERLWIGSLAILFTSLLAAGTALWVREKTEAGPLRLAWTWLAGGLGLWALADILRPFSLQGNTGGTAGFTLMDGSALAGYLLLWIGLALYPRKARQHFGRLPLLFDTTIVTTAALTWIWIAVLQPLMTALPISGKSLPALLYPSADLVSLFLITTLLLLSDAARLPAPLGWAGIGLAAFTLSDLALASQMTSGYSATGVLADLGWVFGDLLLLLAALSELYTPPEPAPKTITLRLLLRSVQRLLPLVFTLALGGYTLFLWQFYGQLNQPGLWVTLVLALGLVARQGFLAGESELQKYASLVNSIAEPAFVCDQRGRLRLVNPALLASAGYASQQDLLGQPLQQIIHPAAGAARIITQALIQGWSGEVHLRRRGGGMIPISLALRPLRSERDGRLALAGTAHDLSEQKQQQTALQAAYEQIAADRTELENLNTRLEQRVAEKTADLLRAMEQLEQQNLALQQLDQLKSDFVSLVSHELRAPLTNISGGIELLLSPSNNIGAHPRRNLELVRAEINRLSRFVESILDLSALEAGHMPLYLAPLSLQSVIQNLRKSGLDDNPHLRWQMPEDLPPVLADEQALSSVLFHLLDNACKYAPNGEISIFARLADRRLRIDIADRGPGIPEEALPFIFDRFYRQDTADARAVYGHGLGLYIVSHLLSAMGGEIRAANQPEGGACFTFWLPLVE